MQVNGQDAVVPASNSSTSVATGWGFHANGEDVPETTVGGAIAPAAAEAQKTADGQSAFAGAADGGGGGGATATSPPVVSAGVSDNTCLLYTSPSPRDRQKSRMPSSA